MKMIFVFLILFLGLITYVFARGYFCFTATPALKYSYIAVYVLLFVTMMTGFIFADQLPVKFAQPVFFIGYTFLMLVIYMAMMFIVIDLARLVNYLFIHCPPESMLVFRKWATAAGFFIVAVILIIGNYRYNHPQVTEINITAAATPPQGKTLKIVAASDLHFGSNIGKKKAQQYVQLINEQHPDIVLLAGDIADRSIDPVVKEHIDEDLRKIKATYGMYGAPGNHEFYSANKFENYKYYEQSGINMLIDKAILIDSSFYVIGRDDRTNPDRLPLLSLVNDLDKSLPVIVIDHQPFHLEEGEANNITLQISGHTHNGQFFPGNLIVKPMYELAYGYKQKGNSHFYVSSGLGLWGPKYRIGTKSEIVVINLAY